MTFRPDINGLRAWAVVAVVLFHFGIPGFSGGFVGVDVFFVISGFLMTRIISDGLMRRATGGDFSILRFYLSRALRIVPALLVLCMVVLLIGWTIMPQADFRILVRHVVASVTFVSNMTYWRESGYFAASSLDKWLLHTWSLSVEWQFYLLLPIVLSAAWAVRPTRTTLTVLTGCGLIASMALSILFTPDKPTSAFFLLPSRSWEMSAGGLLYLVGPRQFSEASRRWIEAAGFALIVCSIAWFSAATSWPGWRAMLPVSGTVLVLLAARSESRWTGLSIAQWLGSNSYSIYLWHWPVIVAIAYYNLQGEAAVLAFGLLATLLLGHLSFRIVESRLRSALGRLTPARQVRFVASAAALVLTASFALSSIFPRSYQGENGNAVDQDVTMALSSNGWCFRDLENYGDLPIDDRIRPCLIGNTKASVSGLLIGDSFAGQYEPFWSRIGKEAGLKIEAVTTNWCYPSVTNDFIGPERGRAYAQCLVDRALLRSRIADYDFIVYAGYWRAVFAKGRQQGLFDAITLAAGRNKLVIVMASPVEFDTNVNAQHRRRTAIGLPFDIHRFSKTIDQQTRAADATVEAYTKGFANVIFVDRDAIFDVDGAPSDVTHDNVLFTLDGTHISVYGAKQAAEAFIRTPLYERIRTKIVSSASRSDDPSATLGSTPTALYPLDQR